MRKTVVTVALVLMPVSFAHAQVPPAEREAMVLFYYAAGGPGWTNKSGWVTATEGTECSWYGVLCTSDHLYVLRLSDNNLTGTVSSSLGDLSPSYFRTLELNDNGLTGSIPPELGNLTGLTHLYLRNNRLSGSIPPELGDLSLLVGLGISDNQLTGSIPPELGNLSNLADLNLESNQLSGIIPPELGNLSKLYGLYLNDNQITGNIPPSLGNMSSLMSLYLENNQLTGSIPPELGNLSNLNFRLDLSNNQLTGSIPPELGSLVSVKQLFLNTNQLSGSIPPELGDLAALQYLYLYSNMLSGEIPTDLMDLSALVFMGSDISFNALYTNDGPLIAFLNMIQYPFWPWQETQTIAPENLSVGEVGDHTVWLRWESVPYQINPGGYEVFSSPTGSGVWTSRGWTDSKAITTFPVTGLNPGATYDLAVVTFTDPHAINLNLVTSDFSAELTQTTANIGCGQPVIAKMGAGPFTLALTGSFSAYEWSTGETTSSIDVDPSSEQWYWVNVTSAGPCEETAATLVVPSTSLIFADGFESGDTTEWSNTVP